MSKNDVSHFYRLLPDGAVESAYGASIKEAREGKLYASATMALKMVANVGLDIWIRGNLLDAVINNPRGPVESVEQYKERIANLSEVKRTDAADFGTALHNALEHYPLACQDDNVVGHYNACLPWLKANVASVIGNELMMADEDIGFAGKTDLVFFDHAGVPQGSRRLRPASGPSLLSINHGRGSWLSMHAATRRNMVVRCLG